MMSGVVPKIPRFLALTALDLPGPSRRVRIEPVQLPAPARSPERRERETAPVPPRPELEPEPAVPREPARA